METRRDFIVQRVIDACGGPTALAALLRIRPPSIYSWHRIPAQHVKAIHSATGIPRHEMRPDIFDPPSEAEAGAEPPSSPNRQVA